MAELFVINNFDGEIPKISPRLLSEPQAQKAENSRLESGELDTWQGDIIEKDLGKVGNIKTIYKHDRTWLYFDKDVQFAKAPIIGDEFNRLVFTGMDVPRVTDNNLAKPDAPFKSLILGLPKPPEKAAVVAGTEPDEGEIQDTFWVYTYVRRWQDGKEDEGVPSPVSDMIQLKSAQPVTLTFHNDISNPADYGITHKRIYRTNTSSKGVAQYQYVGEVAIGATTFTDTLTSDKLGEVLPSENWNAPPDKMEGIVTVGNGMLAGFTGNTVHMSEVFQAHGWPASARFTVDHPIVGLGSFQNTLIVLTTGFPYLVTVQDPQTFTVIPFKERIPCKSKKSIVSTARGVIYAAHNGIYLINQSGPTLLTGALFTKIQWEAFDPTSFSGLFHDANYYAFWKAAVPYVDEFGQLKYTFIQGGFIIDPFSTAKTISRINVPTETTFHNVDSNDIFYVRKDEDANQTIYKWGGMETLHKHYTWKSKEFTSSSGFCNLSAARVLADYNRKRERDKEDYYVTSHFTTLEDQELYGEYGAHDVARFEIAGDRLQEIKQFLVEPPILIFTMYVDGVKKFEKVLKNNRVFRLPAGMKGKSFEFEVGGNIPVWQIQAATSASEIV